MLLGELLVGLCEVRGVVARGCGEGWFAGEGVLGMLCAGLPGCRWGCLEEGGLRPGLACRRGVADRVGLQRGGLPLGLLGEVGWLRPGLAD